MGRGPRDVWGKITILAFLRAHPGELSLDVATKFMSTKRYELYMSGSKPTAEQILFRMQQWQFKAATMDPEQIVVDLFQRDVTLEQAR
jgi:hypothetical protein